MEYGPVNFQTGHYWMPKVGDPITVTMPGELMRCEVVDLVPGDKNRVMVRVTGVPISKMHFFRTGDVIGARRRIDFGRAIWEALDDRQFIANRSPVEPPQMPDMSEAPAVAAAEPEPEQPKKKTRSKGQKVA